MADESKKIIVDEDWKAQVEAEKQAVRQNAPEVELDPTNDESDPPLPPASFGMLVSMLASDAMISLGQMPNPVTGKMAPRKNQAKYLIDTIEMLCETTRGNVPAEETSGVEDLLHQLRLAFVQMPESPARPNN